MTQESATPEATAAGAPQDRSLRAVLASLEIDGRLLGMVAALIVIFALQIGARGTEAYGLFGIPHTFPLLQIAAALFLVPRLPETSARPLDEISPSES